MHKISGGMEFIKTDVDENDNLLALIAKLEEAQINAWWLLVDAIALNLQKSSG